MRGQCVVLLCVVGVAFVMGGGVMTPPPPPFGGLLEDLSAPLTLRDIVALGCLRALRQNDLLQEALNPREKPPTKREELATLLSRVLSRDRRSPQQLVRTCRPILLGPPEPAP